MARLKDPSYRLHKPRGQAVLTLPDGLGGRRSVYLGSYDSDASRNEYNRVLAEWKANGRQWRRTPTAADLTVNELVLAYWEWAENYYRHVDGTPTTEQRNIRQGFRRFILLYGDTAAKSFDAMALDAVRNRMIDDGLCRDRSRLQLHFPSRLGWSVGIFAREDEQLPRGWQGNVQKPPYGHGSYE